MAADVDISEVVSVTTTVEDNFPTREGFGTPIVVGYHTHSLARVESYSSIAEVSDAGYPLDHHVYLACAAAFAQNPRPELVKVGRRDGAPTQLIRYTPITTALGFVYVFTIAGVEITHTVPTGASVASICAAIVALIDASSLGADADSIMVALATSASPQTLDTEFDGVIGLGTISPPRKITVTRSSHANQDAVTAVLTGLDEFGEVQTENLAFADTGGEVVTSTKRYSKVTSLAIPAQGGTGGTTAIGTAACVDATDGTTHFDVTATVAGTWFPHVVDGDVASTDLALEDRTAQPGTTVQTDLAAILAADDDFYGVCVADAQSRVQILAIAAWAQSNAKMFIADTFDTMCTDGAEVDDVLSDMMEAEYSQSAGFYHRGGHGYFPSARWFGKMLPKDPGTETWALKTLDGLPVDSLSSTERTALKAKNANFYCRIGGLNLTLGTNNGGIASSGRFLDLVRFIQSTQAAQREAALAVLANNDKVAQTKKGIAMIVAAVRGPLLAGVTIGAISDTPAPTVTAPDPADISSADKAARRLPDVKSRYTYASPIHKVEVANTLSL